MMQFHIARKTWLATLAASVLVAASAASAVAQDAPTAPSTAPADQTLLSGQPQSNTVDTGVQPNQVVISTPPKAKSDHVRNGAQRGERNTYKAQTNTH